jgi:transmembrane sensor
MMSKDEQMRAAVAEQAVDWFMERAERPLDARESAALMAWYEASPINVEEFLGVAAIARDLRNAARDSEHSVEALVARARADDVERVQSRWPRTFAAISDLGVRRWQASAVALAALILVSFSLFWMSDRRGVRQQARPSDAAVLHFSTHHGEQQIHRLADGSVLHLNTDTAVTVQYSDTQRQVVLTSGQAAFEVVHEVERPFHLFAGSAEVFDLGTTFDVRLRSDATVVTVVEGRVAVALSDMSASRVRNSIERPTGRLIELGPNQQLSVSRGQWPSTPTDIDAKRTTAWLHRQIAFNREPLERVAAEINRYAPKQIEIMSPELRKMEITGVFSIDDTEEFLEFLRTLDGVRVDVTATQIRVSMK